MRIRKSASPAPVAGGEDALTDDLDARAERLLRALGGCFEPVVAEADLDDLAPLLEQRGQKRRLVLFALAGDEVGVRVLALGRGHDLLALELGGELRQVRASEVSREIGRGELRRAVNRESHLPEYPLTDGRRSSRVTGSHRQAGRRMGSDCVRRPWFTRDVRVFLSSTYEDLIEEREAVAERLGRDGHEVVRMEDFGSRDDVPLETCLDAMESGEAYVLLLGSRYGSIEPNYNLSYTHIEYERARELDHWVFAYVRECIDEELEGADADDRLRLLDFRDVIERSHTVRRPYFSAPEELAEHVSQDLAANARHAQVRPSFGRSQRAIEDPISYAGRTVRHTRLQMNPIVVVVADLAVLEAEGYPQGRGRRMREKVRQIVAYLEREGASWVVFNEIPAPDVVPVVEQRLAEIRRMADVIVALVHGKSDAQKLQSFIGTDAQVAAWLPDHIDVHQAEGVRLAAYSQTELQQCGLALRVQRHLDALIDQHVVEAFR